MKILAIGNSFSQDACTYIHQAAAAQGADVTVVNLYIGGCSLETHWKNVENDAPAYEYQRNGLHEGRHASIREALEEGGWDVIVTQQCSHDSGWMDTYEPFLGLLVDFFRRHAPGARLALHETWAYEIDSDHERYMRYSRSQQVMYTRLRQCYTAMACKYGLQLIPSGDVIQSLRQEPPFHVPSGGRSLCRDGYHMSLGCGRYALACTWLHTLCGLKAADNPYQPESAEEADSTLLSLIRRTADAVCQQAQHPAS